MQTAITAGASLALSAMCSTVVHAVVHGVLHESEMGDGEPKNDTASADAEESSTTEAPTVDNGNGGLNSHFNYEQDYEASRTDDSSNLHSNYDTPSCDAIIANDHNGQMMLATTPLTARHYPNSVARTLKHRRPEQANNVQQHVNDARFVRATIVTGACIAGLVGYKVYAECQKEDKNWWRLCGQVSAILVGSALGYKLCLYNSNFGAIVGASLAFHLTTKKIKV